MPLPVERTIVQEDGDSLVVVVTGETPEKPIELRQRLQQGALCWMVVGIRRFGAIAPLAQVWLTLKALEPMPLPGLLEVEPPR
jgi:hypothetical protein